MAMSRSWLSFGGTQAPVLTQRTAPKYPVSLQLLLERGSRAGALEPWGTGMKADATECVRRQAQARLRQEMRSSRPT